MTFWSAIQVLIFFGTVFEVFKVVRIHYVVCDRTPYILVYGYEMFLRSILGLSSRAFKRWWQYVLTESSVPKIQTTQSHKPEGCNFESWYSAFFMHCVTIVFITNQLNTCIWPYMYLLFCIIFWSEQEYVTENVMSSNKRYCLISVFSWFVIISKFAIFSVLLWTGGGGEVEDMWYGRKYLYQCLAA